MRKLFIAVLVFTLTIETAIGACLLDDYSVSAEFSRSTVVALGRVASERQISEQKDSGVLEGVIYTVRVDELFRGHAGKTLTVFSENSSSRLLMQGGQTYLLFLYSQSGRLSADYCGNSGLSTNKQSVLNQVRALGHVR